MSGEQKVKSNPISILVARLLGLAGLIYGGTSATALGLSWSVLFLAVWTGWMYWALTQDDDFVAKKGKGDILGASILASMLMLGWIWAVIGFLRYLF